MFGKPCLTHTYSAHTAADPEVGTSLEPWRWHGWGGGREAIVLSVDQAAQGTLKCTPLFGLVESDVSSGACGLVCPLRM